MGEFLAKIFKSRAFWWFWLCVIFAILIWLVGPAIAFYGNMPLAGSISRGVIISLIFLIWLIIHFKNQIRFREIFAPSVHKSPIDEAGQIDRSEKKHIAGNFKTLITFLSKQGTVYDLPWYLVMGHEGAGKTSLLKDMELRLSYQTYHQVNHRHASFQWALAEEGLFMDLPADFCWQRTLQQKFNWQMYLKYLKRARRRRPLNGLILMVSLQDLMEGRLNEWQESIRLRLHELQQRLGIKIPVYLVLSHVDIIAGFVEFTTRFTEQERQQILGFTFKEKGEPLEQFAVLYDELVASLNHRLKRDLDQEWLTSKNSAGYYFPMQMAALHAPLLELAKTLFAGRRYLEASLWRGLYFVSHSVSSKTRYDVILDETTLDAIDLPKAFKNRRYFVENMLRQVMLKEAEFVGTQPFYERHFNHWQKLKWMLLLGGTGLIFTMWAISMSRYESYNQAVLELLNTPTAPSINISTDAALNNMYGDLTALGTLYHQGTDSSGAGWLHLGLLVHSSGPTAVKILYQHRLVQQFLPYLLNILHGNLQTTLTQAETDTSNMNAVESLYLSLSSYLMFKELNEMKANQIENVLNPMFSSMFPNNEALQTWFASHVQDTLNLGFAAQNLDESLIQSARQVLWNSPVYIQAYLLLKLNNLGNNQKLFNLAEQMDASSESVFSNFNQVSVPLLFSKEGYKEIYQKQASSSLNQVANQAWVLGSDSHIQYSGSDLKKYQADMDNLYWTDYMNAWDSGLAEINLAPFENLQQAIDTLNVLSERNSPFIDLLTLIQKNTDYGTVLTQSLNSTGATTLSTSSPTALNSADSYAANMTDNIVTNHFSPLTSLLASNGGKGSAIQTITASLGMLQQYLTSLANSSNPNLSAYNAAVAIFAGQADQSLTTLASEAASAPMPLSRWLNQIVSNSYQVIFASANQYLSSEWQATVSSYYQQSLAGRFPFVKSANEVTIQDFSDFFKPGGVEDGFVKKYLSPFLTANPSGQTEWNSVNSIPFSSNNAIPVEITQAGLIRNTFFGGTTGSLNFTISPLGISGSSKADLSYDGKSVEISGSGAGVAMMWPPQNTDGTVSLTFNRVFLSNETQNYYGPWGLFHLLEASTLVRAKYGSQYQVTTPYDGMSVSFTLSANSVVNPFDLKVMRNYSCPNSF